MKLKSKVDGLRKLKKSKNLKLNKTLQGKFKTNSNPKIQEAADLMLMPLKMNPKLLINQTQE